MQLEFRAYGNVKQVLAYKYWADEETEEIVYGGSKASGKSYLGCKLICGDALMYPGTHYFIARKTLNDLRKHTSTSIVEVLTDWKIPKSAYKYNGQDNYYLFANGSRIYFIECKPMPSDPLYYRFGSIQMTRGWVEEAGEVEEAAKNALAACCGRWKNMDYKLTRKLLITCNPAKNFLYRDYYLPNKNGTLPAFRKFIQALPSDNKRLAPDYIPGLERTFTPNENKRLLQGIWEYDDDPTVLIDYEKILNIHNDKPGIITDYKCMTNDIARLGGDRIVEISWQGYIGRVKSWSRVKLPETLRRIESDRLKVGIGKDRVLVDSDGIGAAIEDFSHGFLGFRANAPALPDPEKKRDGNGKVIRENYDMLKSQCGFRMADRINNDGVILICDNKDDEILIRQELEQVKQKDLDTDMKKGLVPKDEIKKTLGRSPDFWDAILMREFFNLRTKKMRIKHLNGNNHLPSDEYAPKRRYDFESY